MKRFLPALLLLLSGFASGKAALTECPLLSAEVYQLPADSVEEKAQVDSLHIDTMREVTVRAGRHIPLPGMVVNPGLKEEVVPPPSLGSILEKWLPGINDKITHPFAIKQRKKERRRKRSMKALEDFDRVKTFDELLREAYILQMKEDSVAAGN